MFKSVLVANRGEIARRVFRTARRMGMRCLAVYSDADADAPHVREADEAMLIGPAPARESYLAVDRVLAAATAMGAQAVHPGYGFLSENAEFAEAVAAAGMVWIGPPPSAIRAMGLKDAAKTLMQQAGVPVTPGYQGADQSGATLAAAAARTGYPVLIKAVAGGGGKGMRRVDDAADFAAALASAQREAKAAFGDDRVLIERYITRPRHIEVQVFGDRQGEVVHLYERDCSLQRRHQKVIEEAPAPGMDAATRVAITEAAVRAARAVNYVGAGTIEFIADASDGLKPDRIWFMEMNTRLQVEHPVTEAVTGVDLVEWQLRVAAGEPLPLKQDQITLGGHAVEARLYAEDPANGFLPSTGRLEHFVLPDNIRVEAGVEQGGEVSQFYDPMIAKLIAHAETRNQAAAELACACARVEVWPVRTNAGFLKRCLDHPRFGVGDVDTGFIGAEAEALAQPAPGDIAAAVAALARIYRQADLERCNVHGAGDWRSPWENRLRGPLGMGDAWGFRLNAAPRAEVAVRCNGGAVVADLQRAPLAPHADAAWQVRIGERTHALNVTAGRGGGRAVGAGLETIGFIADAAGETVFIDGDAIRFEAATFGASAGAASDGSLRAPMPGRIVAVAARAGDAVVKGQPVVVLEAMKMEHALTAPFDGRVEDLPVAIGDQVAEGAVLARVVPEAAA